MKGFNACGEGCGMSWHKSCTAVQNCEHSIGGRSAGALARHRGLAGPRPTSWMRSCTVTTSRKGMAASLACPSREGYTTSTWRSRCCLKSASRTHTRQASDACTDTPGLPVDVRPAIDLLAGSKALIRRRAVGGASLQMLGLATGFAQSPAGSGTHPERTACRRFVPAGCCLLWAELQPGFCSCWRSSWRGCWAGWLRVQPHQSWLSAGLLWHRPRQQAAEGC